MDTTDTTSPDTIVLDADIENTETESFGKEVTKTLITSTATSAGVFAGFVVIALVTPKVKEFFDRRKKKDVVEEAVTVDPENSTEN
jgi:hypothetical protein